MRKDAIVIENAKIIFRNFSGRETDYNRSGDRNFNIIIDDSNQAADLKNLGWNVRELTNKNDPDDITYILKVKVRFDMYPPKVYTVTPNKNVTELDESTVGLLDNADIAFVDAIITPYNWERNGEQGVTAYLQKMYVNIEEDALDSKYAMEEFPVEDDVIHPEEMPLK